MGGPRWNFAKMFSTEKTRLIGLPYAAESMMICYAIAIQYRSVTDRQTDSRKELLYQCRVSDILKQLIMQWHYMTVLMAIF